MEEKELKAEDLFVRKENLQKETEIANKVEKAVTIPSDYLTIKLSSLGKLGFPAIVHVRDYTFEEAIKMAELSEENVTEVLIDILNNVIFEDVDIRNAHRQDILEILLSIYGTWYSATLENFRYFVNLDLPENEKEKKENISVATLPINSLKTVSLKKKAKLPIKIAKGDFEVELVLPKVENELIASKFIEEKYVEKENELSEVIQKVKNGIANKKEQKAYDELQRQKGIDFLRVAQSLLIDSFNGKKLENLSEKLETIQKIPLNVWAIYNNEISKNFTFGVSQEVEFECSINHTPITRSFQFREIHFLPSLVQENHSGFSVSLG